jgi:hypothetical protein
VLIEHSPAGDVTISSNPPRGNQRIREERKDWEGLIRSEKDNENSRSAFQFGKYLDRRCDWLESSSWQNHAALEVRCYREERFATIRSAATDLLGQSSEGNLDGSHRIRRRDVSVRT